MWGHILVINSTNMGGHYVRTELGRCWAHAGNNMGLELPPETLNAVRHTDWAKGSGETARREQPGVTG